MIRRRIVGNAVRCLGITVVLGPIEPIGCDGVADVTVVVWVIGEKFFFLLRRQWCVFGVGGVVVGVGGGVTVGDHVDGVGDQARVLVGGDGLAVVVSVGEMFGGQFEQFVGFPGVGVGVGDRGHQRRPGRVGGDGLGDGGAKDAVQVAYPGWP